MAPSTAMLRIASSCAWKLPSRLVEVPGGIGSLASSARMAATTAAMSAPGAALASTTMRRREMARLLARPS